MQENGFINDEAMVSLKAKQYDCLELTLRKKTFEEGLLKFKQRFKARGYLGNIK